MVLSNHVTFQKCIPNVNFQVQFNSKKIIKCVYLYSWNSDAVAGYRITDSTIQFSSVQIGFSSTVYGSPPEELICIYAGLKKMYRLCR